MTSLKTNQRKPSTTLRHKLNFKHYQSFLKSHQTALQRISRASLREAQLEDVQGEIWLMADEQSQKLDRTIDFSDPEDQELLIAYTHQKLVKYCETTVRYSMRIDRYDSEDSKPNYSNILTQRETEDPVNELVTPAGIATTTPNPHSLGGAWINVLDLCNNRMTLVSYFLKISLSHSYRCLNKVLHIAQRQHHLDLGLPDETTSAPRPWRPYRLYRELEQLAFLFDDELPFT